MFSVADEALCDGPIKSNLRAPPKGVISRPMDTTKRGKDSAVCWYVYVIATVDGCFYAGITTNIARRYAEHTTQGQRTAKYLRAHKPQRLVLQQAIGSRSLALRIEHQFKRLPRSAKSAIVAEGRLELGPSGRIRIPHRDDAPQTSK